MGGVDPGVVVMQAPSGPSLPTPEATLQAGAVVALQ